MDPAGRADEEAQHSYVLTVLPPIKTQDSRFVWVRLAEQVAVFQVETGRWTAAVDWRHAQEPLPLAVTAEVRWRFLQFFDSEEEAQALKNTIGRAMEQKETFLDLQRSPTLPVVLAPGGSPLQTLSPPGNIQVAPENLLLAQWINSHPKVAGITAIVSLLLALGILYFFVFGG